MDAGLLLFTAFWAVPSGLFVAWMGGLFGLRFATVLTGACVGTAIALWWIVKAPMASMFTLVVGPSISVGSIVGLGVVLIARKRLAARVSRLPETGKT